MYLLSMNNNKRVLKEITEQITQQGKARLQ